MFSYLFLLFDLTFFIEAVACHLPPLLFPVQSYGGPVRCQVPGGDSLFG